jgi:CubicO group peptidase (beta-lactamase class C family)
MQSTSKKVDALFAHYNKANSPGCALAVIDKGQIVYQRGYGMADIAKGEKITPQSAFYIASVSKQFTAACMLLLAERGAIALDDDVRRYFPELPDYGAKIAIRHCIHHTSGLRDNLDLWYAAGRSFVQPFDNVQCLELMLKQRGVNFAPGEKHLYCNTGYKLLAELVPRVCGLSLRQFAEREIFAPLGMKHTLFDDNNEKIKRRVISYRESDGRYVPQEKAFTIVGSGGIVTTVGDLFLWDQNFYDGTVGGAGFVAQMYERGQLNDGMLLDYASGLSHGGLKGLKTIGHGGAMLGFRTHLLRFSSEYFSVVVLGNYSGFDAYKSACQVADIYLKERYPLAQYAGLYRCGELDRNYRIYQIEGELVVYLGGEKLVLDSAGFDRFSQGGFDLHFQRDATGAVQSFVLSTGRAQGMVCARKPSRRLPQRKRRRLAVVAGRR